MAITDTFLGNAVLLYIDTTTPVNTAGTAVTPENFVLVACLNENSVDYTTNAIATDSKCSGIFATSIGGKKGWTMAASGNSISVETGEQATLKSHNAMFKLWRTGDPFWALQYDVQNKTARYGVVRMDSGNDSFPTDAAATFTVGLTGIGEIYDQDDLDTTP